MFLTSRFRAARARGDAGAVAVVVALVSLLLFAMAALAVDIGVMYNRRRAAQTDADLAALAGAVALPDTTAARAAAYDYLARNLPAGGPIGPLTNFSDGSLANGEILFPSAYRIRVVVPPRNVEFGFAGAVGISGTDVTAAATAEIRSPAAAMPFFLTLGGANGYSCLKDTSPGGGPPASAVRSVLLQPAPRPPSITSTSPATLSSDGGQTLTVTGDNFRAPAPDVTSVKIDGTDVTFWTVTSRTQLTLSTPPHAPGTAELTITNAHGTASTTLTYVAAPPAPPPAVTSVVPASGPQTGGTDVTVTGTGFTGATAVTFGTAPATSVVVVNDTTITATSPAGTGAVNVRVTNAGGTSGATTANLFTYEADPCAGDSGDFGYLDIPRSKEPDPLGVNDTIMVNIAAGIDHGWSVYPKFVDAVAGNEPAPGTQCRSGVTLIDGAVLDEGGGVEGANCIEIENGNKTANVAEAFLDGWAKFGHDLPPRMRADDGHESITLHGRPDIDGDSIEDFLTVPLAQFVNELDGSAPDPATVSGWLKRDIMDCPRFAIVPVLNAETNPPNGFYPIKDFAGVFIDGPIDHGFQKAAGGPQIEAVRAYAFSLDAFLPGVLSAGETDDTVTFLGSGPKVPVLVHDAADPSY